MPTFKKSFSKRKKSISKHKTTCKIEKWDSLLPVKKSSPNEEMQDDEEIIMSDDEMNDTTYFKSLQNLMEPTPNPKSF